MMVMDSSAAPACQHTVTCASRGKASATSAAISGEYTCKISQGPGPSRVGMSSASRIRTLCVMGSTPRALITTSMTDTAG